MKWYVAGFLAGPHLSKIIDPDGRLYPVTPKERHDDVEQDKISALALPLEQKCKLALLSLLVLDLDGEAAEMFGDDYLGKDKQAVGRILSRIPNEELMKMRISRTSKGKEYNLRFFRKKVKEWLNVK